MTPQIQKVRMLSARLRRLKRAKLEVAEVRYTLILGDEFLCKPLDEYLARIDGKIDMYKKEIKGVVYTIPNYDKTKHIVIEYLSEEDTKLEMIDISLAGDKTAFLNLETGEITINESYPKQG